VRPRNQVCDPLPLRVGPCRVHSEPRSTGTAVRRSESRLGTPAGRPPEPEGAAVAWDRPPASSSAPGLGPDPLAALLAAPLQDQPTTLGPHPDQEAMGPLSLPVVGLKRPLHALVPLVLYGRQQPGLGQGSTV